MRGTYDVFISLSVLGIILGFMGFVIYRLVKSAIQKLKGTKI